MKNLCSLLGPLVQHTVRQYMNLNNADQLLKWVGYSIYSDIYHKSLSLHHWTLHNILRYNCDTNIACWHRIEWCRWWLTQFLLFLQISGTSPADQENQGWDHHHNVRPPQYILICLNAVYSIGLLFIGLTHADVSRTRFGWNRMLIGSMKNSSLKMWLKVRK